MKGLSGAATVLMLLLAVPLQGQVGPRGMQRQQHMQRQGPRGNRQMQMGSGSADRVLWLHEELQLTDEQVENLKNTNQAARAVQDSARLLMRGIWDQLRDGDITRGQFLDLMTAQREAMTQQQIDLQEQTEAILGDAQKAQLRSRRRGGGEGRAFGRGYRRGRSG